MILEKIRQLYPQLTKSQRRLADFIAASYQEAAFMTASRLARRVGVNEATVIRFAQRLDYAGYPDLIQDIQAIVQEELKLRFETAEREREPLFDVLNNEVENLQRAISHISAPVAREAVKLLQEAERLYVIGQGPSWGLAQLFAASLQNLGLAAVSSLTDPSSLAATLQEMGEQCVVIVIAATPETQDLANALRYANDKGAHTLALTWSPISPCAQAADLAISSPANDLFILPSFAVLATLLDALLQRLAADRLDLLQARLQEISRARDMILNRRRR